MKIWLEILDTAKGERALTQDQVDQQKTERDRRDERLRELKAEIEIKQNRRQLWNEVYTQFWKQEVATLNTSAK